MKKGAVITIDGPSAAGKGTAARELARRFGFAYLDTGAMYRAVALSVRRSGIDEGDEGALAGHLAGIDIGFRMGSGLSQRVLLNGEDVTEEIRTPQISRLASSIATRRAVRERLRQIQRELGSRGSLVAEGRDMGTVVFPWADYKFYLDARPEERARRRWLEMRASGMEVDLEEVRVQQESRDAQDMQRSEAPLHPAPDAVIIDTTNLSVGEVVEILLSTIEGGSERDG